MSLCYDLSVLDVCSPNSLPHLAVFFQAEKVHELNEEIGKLLAKAEQLGAEGNVDESQKILMEVEKVRAKKKEAEVGGKRSSRKEMLLPLNFDHLG